MPAVFHGPNPDCCPVNFKLHHFPEIPEMFFLDSEAPACKMKNIYSSK
jgi:hypothetical protein